MDGRTTSADRDKVDRSDYGACLSRRALCTLVESERRRLSKADAILASLCVALDNAADVEITGTQFSLVAESARDLIAASMECLDSVRLEGTRVKQDMVQSD